MRIAVLVNPRSGAGRSLAQAREATAALAAAGHDMAMLESRAGPAEQWLPSALDGAELLVVVGGDGSVRQICALAADRRLPIYQLPWGTENLLSREFGMSRHVPSLVKATQSPRFRWVDLGFANHEPFLLMASVGLDAEVVHDLTRHRGSSIRHLSYLAPIVRQWRQWRPATLEVVVDGRRMDRGGTGMVVVANCGRYGARLDPCGWADMTDGLLTVGYLPASGRLDALGWAWRCAVRRQRASDRYVTMNGRDVVIRAPEPFRYQLDGDAPATPAVDSMQAVVESPGVRELRLTIRPGALPVLLPVR